MIGLALARRPRGPGPDAEVGMLDVSANALAVLILATMLVLTAAAPPVARGEIRADVVPALPYPAPIDATLPPHSRYVLVLPEGLAPLDLDAFARALAEGPATAATDQGRATIVTDRTLYRDLNDYRVTITPDWPALAAAATALDAGGLEAEAETAARGFDDEGVATTYVVVDGAVAAFAPLYWRLRDAQTPMRWFTVPAGQTIVFARRVEDFERPGRQWN